MNRKGERKVKPMKKIDYEYQLFFLDCMSQSKAGIYARCEEIHIKREIKISLDRLLSGNKKLEDKLSKVDNVLEEVYRYVKDSEIKKVPVETLVKRWINEI